MKELNTKVNNCANDLKHSNTMQHEVNESRDKKWVIHDDALKNHNIQLKQFAMVESEIYDLKMSKASLLQVDNLDKRIEKEFVSKEEFESFTGNLSKKEGAAASDMSEKENKLNGLIKKLDTVQREL